MGIDAKRLEAAALAAVLLFVGGAALLPESKAVGCGCPVPCVKCCCSSGGDQGAELCVVRDRGGSAPRSEMPPTSRLRATEAVFASPAFLPHPTLESRLGAPELLLPVSLVRSPEVPPPRAAAGDVAI